jgi:hypothetical protein
VVDRTDRRRAQPGRRVAPAEGCPRWCAPERCTATGGHRSAGRPLLVGRTRVTLWLEQPPGRDVVVALATAHAAVAGPTVYLPLVAGGELHGALGGLLDLAGYPASAR